MGGAPGEPQHRLERVERARPDVAEDHSQCREAECGQASGVRPACYRINSYVRQRLTPAVVEVFHSDRSRSTSPSYWQAESPPAFFSPGRPSGFSKIAKKRQGQVVALIGGNDCH